MPLLPTEKIRLYRLSVVALLLVGGIVWSHFHKEVTPKPHYQMMREASERYRTSMEILWNYCQQDGRRADNLADPNQTGYIGVEISDMTTTLGSLEAKRTATNPNFAGLILDLLVTMRVRRGDCVCLAFSGSFPSLNIASIIACEVLGVTPCIISSLGASMYGANRLELTYMDIEKLLFDTGVIHTRSRAFSLGGEKDIGSGMPEEVLGILHAKIQESGIQCIYEPHLEKNIEARMKLYTSCCPKIKALLNSGGTITSLGGCTHSITIPHGIIVPSYLSTLPCRHRERGLIVRMLERGVPVLHLLNIKDLAYLHGLPIDPVPLPTVGEGDIYYTVNYPTVLVSGVLVMAVMLLVGFRISAKQTKKN